MPRPAHRRVVADRAFAVEIVEAIIHEHHSLLRRRLHRVLEEVQLVFANQISHGVVRHHQLVSQHAPGPVRARQQILCDDSLERIRQLQDDLALRAALEDSRDALQRVRHVRRMHRRQHQMPRLRRRQHRGDGFGVPHFAHDDDVRVLAQHMSQRAVERMHIRQHLLLHHDGAVVPMHELDGVLDGDDLAATLAVDEVDEVIERRGLARARRAGDEEEPVWPAHQLIDLDWQSQLLPRGDALTTEAKAHLGMTVSLIERHSNPADHRMPHGDAELPFALEGVALRLVHDLERDLVHVRLHQRVALGQDDLAIDAKRRRHTSDDVQVGGVVFVSRGKKAVERGGGHSNIPVPARFSRVSLRDLPERWPSPASRRDTRQ